jgi:cell division protein FtsI/penicillin-binding protein 2
LNSGLEEGQRSYGIDHRRRFADCRVDDDFEPNNYGEKFYGPVTLRRTLTKSLNVATVKLAEMTGLEKIAALAKQAGLNGKLLATPALALGAYEVTPLEIAGAYTIFANAGVKTEPSFVRSVSDSKGSSIERAEPKLNRADPRIAYPMTGLMEGVITARGRAADWIPQPPPERRALRTTGGLPVTPPVCCASCGSGSTTTALNLDGATRLADLDGVHEESHHRPTLAGQCAVRAACRGHHDSDD